MRNFTLMFSWKIRSLGWSQGVTFFQYLFAHMYIHTYRETHRKTSVGKILLISSSAIPAQSRANLEVRFNVKIRSDCSGSCLVKFWLSPRMEIHALSIINKWLKSRAQAAQGLNLLEFIYLQNKLRTLMEGIMWKQRHFIPFTRLRSRLGL